MSRSGYHDDLEPWALIRWRGQVASATRGYRGQQLFRDMLEALDAMPIKELVRSELEDDRGNVCALGALGRKRGIAIGTLDPEEPHQVAAAFNIAHQLAREIVYHNDDFGSETPEHRWARMRAWVSDQITPEEL